VIDVIDNIEELKETKSVVIGLQNSAKGLPCGPRAGRRGRRLQTRGSAPPDSGVGRMLALGAPAQKFFAGGEETRMWRFARGSCDCIRLDQLGGRELCGIAACLPAMLIQPRGELNRDHKAMRFECDRGVHHREWKGICA
jgi:hypothetical protein